MRKKGNETEADEENMASRLQLDMGVYFHWNQRGRRHNHAVLERDNLARKSARSGEKSGAVNVFRGINFDDWLRLFMQVHFPFFFPLPFT